MQTHYAAGLLLAAALASNPARAAELGDPAPPLQVAEWFNGEPVQLEASRGKTVHVIEFWATWSVQTPPSILQLTDLQKKFKDKVVFIGISDEEPAKVKAYAAGAGEKMNYRVAADDDHKTTRAYMDGFKVRGVPFAFVVDPAGAVVWYGHPLGGLEATLNRVLAGQHDLGAAKRSAAAERVFGEFLVLVRNRAADPAKLEEMSRQILTDGASNAFLMNEFAWTLLTDRRIRYRNPDVVLRAAKAACEASEGKDPAILDTYARALFDTGNFEEAVKYQRQAADVATDPVIKAQMLRTLNRYEEKTRK